MGDETSISDVILSYAAVAAAAAPVPSPVVVAQGGDAKDGGGEIWGRRRGKSEGGRAKLFRILLWYSFLMLVGFLYFTHERSRYNSLVNAVQRGIVGDRHYWTKNSVLSPNQDGLDQNTVFGMLQEEVTGPTETKRTHQLPSKELTGYYNIIDGSPLNFHCGQCTLVSSSGQLLNQSAGHEIDKAECVIRMNSAPIRNYENDVGSRTTVRVIGHVNLGKGIDNNTDLQKKLFGNVNERPDIVIVPWLYADVIHKKTDRAWITTQNLSRTFPDVKFYVLTAKKMKLSEEIFNKEVGISRKEAHTWMSTGWMTVLFALDACYNIDIYGLVAPDHCQIDPNDTTLYHYYEPDFRTECDYYKASEGKLQTGHKFITEKYVFAKWSLTFGNIRFHYPSWAAKRSNLTELDTPFLRIYRASRESLKVALANGEEKNIKLLNMLNNNDVEGRQPKDFLCGVSGFSKCGPFFGKKRHPYRQQKSSFSRKKLTFGDIIFNHLKL
ncbi:alpha-N-acetylgalactosaminide alpha-2,6-sialyltransferase 5-like [Amphiura filiformis]|uniref:alpha-N-acetylgalactosaminide alpha-2,6-sialyltransferase 5-like n=1 Tax=Amphiura filiformis TaxID=82378 RepID=UPI003B215EEF